MKKTLSFLFLILCYTPLYALPKGFVYLKDIAPDIIQDMRYATSNNFIGNPIPGYKKGRCIITRQAAEQLKKAEREIRKKGYTLKVYDCYRPQQSVDYFYQWSQKFKDERQKAAFYPRVEKKELFKKNYIALSSGHSRGSTLDLTLVKLNTTSKPNKDQITRCYDITSHYLDDDSIDMGTRFDCMDKSANIDYGDLSQAQKNNRKLLQKLMIRYGFKPYYYEWWHYTLANEPFPGSYFNFLVK
jgi:D-alanyl-D-alanine dipeptidase